MNQNIRDELSKLLFTPQADWFRELPDGDISEHWCAIVSIDIKGSSSKDIKKEEQFKAKQCISHIVILWAIECGGEPLFWAGDGGAILFDYNKKPTDDQRTKLKVFTKKLVDASKNDRLVRTELQKAYEINDPDQYRTELLKILNSTDAAGGRAAGEISFHLRLAAQQDNLIIDKLNKSVTHGDGLNFILKYEREISVEDACAYSLDLEMAKCKDDDPLWDCDRPPKTAFPRLAKYLGHNLMFNIYPKEKEDYLVFHYLSCKNVQLIPKEHFETKLQELIENIPMECAHPLWARLYNISLNTLESSYYKIWESFFNKNVDILLVMPSEYPTPQGGKRNDKDSMLLFANKLLRGITSHPEFNQLDTARKEQFIRDKIRTFFEKVTLIRADNHYLLDLALNNRFSFSSYFFKKNQDSPTAGAVAYLIEPFSHYKPQNDAKIWWYNEIYFYPDDTVNSHLRDISGKINDCYRAALNKDRDCTKIDFVKMKKNLNVAAAKLKLGMSFR